MAHGWPERIRQCGRLMNRKWAGLNALLITGDIFRFKFFISCSLCNVHFHPELLLISDPSKYAVTHTMGDEEATQMNPLLLFYTSPSVHISGCVTATCNLSQPLCGILTVVHKANLDSWAKTAGEALYKIICDSCGAKEGYQRFDLCSNEGYLPGVGVWDRPSLTLGWGH